MSLRLLLDEVMELEIPRSPKMVLVSLLKHRNGTTGLCAPGVDTIAQQTGLCKRQVYRVLRYLEQHEGAGKISPIGNTMGGAGRTTIYRLNLRGCALEDGQKTVTSRVTFGSNGDFRRDIRPDISSTRKTNKGLNTMNTLNTVRLPPQREKRGSEGRSKFARAIATIDRLCAGDE